MTSIPVSLSDSETIALPFWIRSGLKRLFDITISFLGLLFLSPIFAILAVAIVRDTPGPVFYRGRRAGCRGKPFQILKFRTMREEPSSYTGPKVTAHDDPRITSLGRWLRDTKLNELPQLWNVLVGEMSLVGPRPEDPDITETWPSGAQKMIFSVRPGITSPASILYRNEEGLLCVENLLKKYMFELSPDKLRLDQLYVHYCSFMLDLDTLLWTFLILLPRLNNVNLPEKLIFLGPVSRFIRSYVSWFVIDTVIAFITFALTGMIWRLKNPLNIGTMKAAVFMAAFALLFSIVSAILGANRVDWEKATLFDAFDLFVSWLIAMIITSFISVFSVGFPLGLVICASILGLSGFVLVRFRLRLFIILFTWILRFRTQTACTQDQVLIVGTGETAQLAAWLFSHQVHQRKFHISGFVDDDLLKQGTRVYGSRVIGTNSEIPTLLKKHNINLVLLAERNKLNSDFLSLLTTCKESGAQLLVLPDILSTLTSFSQDDQPAESWLNQCAQDCDGSDENPCRHCLVSQIPLESGAELIPAEYRSP